MDDEVRFATDLYRGSAGYYDRYRPPYPEAMITDLIRRAGVSGRGRLLDLARQRRPDAQVLSDAGFQLAGRHEFTVEHRWTLPEIAGFIRSTSALSAAVLGDQAEAFDADLAASLGPHSTGGVFPQDVSFAYELARKPA